MTRHTIPLLVVAGILAACGAGTPERAETPKASYACDFLPTAPRPAWLDGARTQPGFHIGVGSSAFAPGGPDEQIRLARQNAMTELSHGIEVSVESTLETQLRVAKAGERERIQSEITEVKKVASALTLESVEVADRWLDRGSSQCLLWVRVRVPESTVAEMRDRRLHAVRFQRLKAQLAAGRDATKPAGARLESLREASAVLALVDFRHVPQEAPAGFYRAEIDKELRAVEARVAARANVAVTVVDPGLPASIADGLLSSLGGNGTPIAALENTTCSDAESCLPLARQAGARQLMLVRVGRTETKGAMGSLKGSLSVEVTAWDVLSGRVVYGPERASEALLSFSQFTEADWNDAAAKLLANRPFGRLTLCAKPTEKGCS